MDRQGTWEILLLPVGKDAGKGTASVNNPDPRPVATSAWRRERHGEHEPQQTPAEPAGEINKPKDLRGQGAARLAAVLAGESPVGAILSLAP